MRQKKRVEINNFNTFDKKTNSCKLFYNYQISNELKNCLGVSEATFPQSASNLEELPLNYASAGIEKVVSLAYFRQYFTNQDLIYNRLLVYAGDKKIYINHMLDQDYDLVWLYSLSFNNPPIALEYKKNDADTIILADDSVMKVWQTGYSPLTISGTPIITSMCMNADTLFCTIKQPAFKIWYSSNLSLDHVGDITNTSNYLTLDGELGLSRKVVSFDEDVYVFRDFGISKIKNYAGNLSVSQVYQSNSYIYSNTVSVCGNSIVFLTRDGLYSFNGVKVSKLDIDFSNLMSKDNANAVGASLGSKYYLALKLNFEGNPILCENEEDCVNNAVVVVDLTDLSFQIIRGVDVKMFFPLKTEVFEKMLLTFNTQHTDKIGQIVNNSICFNSNLPKFWSSGNIFSTFDVKLLTALTVECEAGVKITLKHDGNSTEFTTNTTGLNSFNFKIDCKKLEIEISSSSQSANVKNIYLDYYEQ